MFVFSTFLFDFLSIGLFWIFIVWKNYLSLLYSLFLLYFFHCTFYWNFCSTLFVMQNFSESSDRRFYLSLLDSSFDFKIIGIRPFSGNFFIFRFCHLHFYRKLCNLMFLVIGIFEIIKFNFFSHWNFRHHRIRLFSHWNFRHY